jgi:hypothetical protein
MPGLEASTRPFRCTETRGQTPILVFLLAFPFAAAAEDLVQVYRDAQRYDAVYAAARHALTAGRERLPQGRALLMPTLNLSGNAQLSRVESDSRDPAVSPSFQREPRSVGYTLTLAQPLFRPQNRLQFGQAEHQVAQAEATFAQAAQDGCGLEQLLDLVIYQVLDNVLFTLAHLRLREKLVANTVHANQGRAEGFGELSGKEGFSRARLSDHNKHKGFRKTQRFHTC